MSLRTALILRGILALAVGVIALVWPGITVGAFVILFAVYAFLAGAMEAGQAFRARGGWSVAGRIVLAVVDIAAGVTALAWPGITVLVLVWWIAVWAVLSGALELAAAFADGRAAGERALFGLTGLISIALGVALAIRPDIAAVTLAQVYGLFSIVSGIAALVLAANVARLRAAFAPPAP
ncbi:HdeD family acid-resistance protein [Dactylosporangium sp. CA-092794]|uniref:HdeD family acid-resistance protein n=1 Tax=Dactylosporangium sp. CA-092794 TaxID=3239929 RepID=UPI003D93E080